MSWEFPEYADNWDEVSRAVKERDGRRCVRCGARSTPGNRLHAHHIISKSKGGTDGLDNLETLCEECHREEHPHMKEYFHYAPSYSSQDYLEKIREERKMKDALLSGKYWADSEYCSNCHKNTRQSVKIEDGVKTYFCFECYKSIKENMPKKKERKIGIEHPKEIIKKIRRKPKREKKIKEEDKIMIERKEDLMNREKITEMIERHKKIKEEKEKTYEKIYEDKELVKITIIPKKEEYKPISMEEIKNDEIKSEKILKHEDQKTFSSKSIIKNISENLKAIVYNLRQLVMRLARIGKF